MISFKPISKKDLLILDDGYSNLKFDDISYELINFKKINFFCLIKTIYNFIFQTKRLSFKQKYKQTLYRMFSPSVIISHHINKRGVECKILCPEIKVAIYQFAYCPEKFNLNHILGNFKNEKNKILFDYLFVYHEEDKISFNNETKVFITGSIKNNEIMILNNKKQKNSLLYISEFDTKNSKDHYYYKNEKYLIGILADFCKKKNLKLNVALRSNRKDKKVDRKKEIDFFNENLGNNYSVSDLDSYTFASQNELVVCLSSNLGIELISRKYKVIFILLNDSKIERYPYLPADDLFVHRNNDKGQIISKLEKIYEVSEQSWMNFLSLNFKNLKFDPGNKIFKTEIKKIINYEKNI
tara:strand:+ start:865 stop:1926 length:1062 start_codon:yes stop_codon:yes gene_type:complete